MTKDFNGIRVIDGDKNVYVFNCSLDTNIDSVQDVLLSTLEGISKLIGYRLVIDGVYKDMDDQVVANQKLFNLYNRLEVGNDMSKEEFGKSMKDIIEKAKISKIGGVRFTTWHGEQVYTDSRGMYVKRSINCCAYGCSNIITGKVRLSLDLNGNISRGQSFTPDDSNVQRYKQGSKKRMCPDCAVKYIKVPKLPEIPSETHEDALGVDAIVTESNPIESGLSKLIDHCKDSGISGEFIKGYVMALVETEQLK